MIVFGISGKHFLRILLFLVEVITITEFKEFQVCILTVGVVRDAFQSTEKQCLTHGIQVCTQRIQQHYQILRRIRLQVVIVSGTRQRVVQNLIETTAHQLLDKKVQFAEIEKIAYETEKKLLKEVSLFDVYEGKNLEAGKKSYAVSFLLQDENATLNDKQIDKIMSKLVRNLEDKLNAKLR